MSDPVCRTCFKILQNKSEYLRLDNKDQPQDRIDIKSKLEACVPELVLDRVKKAVMCYSCVETLNVAYDFKAMCIKMETSITNYMTQTMIKTINLNVATKDAIEGNVTQNDEMNLLPSNNSIRCLACKKWFTCIDVFKRHMNSHMTQLRCLKCDYQTNSNALLKKHLKSHVPDTLFQCTSCDYKTTEKNLFDEHLLTHTVSKVLKCNLCDFKTTMSYNLRRHMNTHKPKRLFKCQCCSFTSHTLIDYQMHIKTHNSKNVFKCKFCSYTSLKQTTMNKHMSRNHKDDNKPKKVTFNSDTFQFTMDDVAFILENDDIEALLNQFREDKVDDFNAYLVSDDDVLEVLKHTDAQEYLKEDQHGTFACLVCKSSFRFKYMLNKHLLEHNDDNQPFKCNKCGFSDKKKSSFKLHMMMHMGEKVFQCDVCNYRTIYYTTFQKHQKKHKRQNMKKELDADMQGNTLPPLRCGECQFESYIEDEMKAHLDMHMISNEFIDGSIHQHFLPLELVN